MLINPNQQQEDRIYIMCSAILSVFISAWLNVPFIAILFTLATLAIISSRFENWK